MTVAALSISDRHGKLAVVALTGALLAGCNAGGNPFGNPFGGQPRVASGQLPVVSQPPPVSGGRPSVTINAPPKRVQDTIVARAERRGTTVVGTNQTGVTLEVPLKASSAVVVQQCGEHQANRTLRVYLETLPNGTGTIVSEDRYVVDNGASSCQLSLTQADVDDANRSLLELKQQSEGARTASSAASGTVIPGDVQPLNPGRPVIPIR
jgi:hypothetical protein